MLVMSLKENEDASLKFVHDNINVPCVDLDRTRQSTHQSKKSLYTPKNKLE